jgi:hypothetical protein
MLVQAPPSPLLNSFSFELDYCLVWAAYRFGNSILFKDAIDKTAFSYANLAKVIASSIDTNRHPNHPPTQLYGSWDNRTQITVYSAGPMSLWLKRRSKSSETSPWLNRAHLAAFWCLEAHLELELCR